jgi:hypothetical protein
MSELPWSVASNNDVRRSTFFGDCHGTVMILGLVFAVLLVGAGFHVASVGHAIVWREWAQDGADHAAYEASLWNARGMNVIVGINIFMSIIMAVLILWRVLMAFVIAAAALSTVACALAFLVPTLAAFCPLAGFLVSLAARLPTIDARVVRAVSKVEHLMHLAERTIATATPLISASASAMSTRDRFGVTGIGLSTTLVPSVPAPRRSGCAVQSLASAAQRLGVGVSLPVVASDDIKPLCDAGSNEIVNLLDFVSQHYTPRPIGFLLAKTFDSMRGLGSPLLCQGGIDSIGQRMAKDELKAQALDTAAKQAQKFCDVANATLCEASACDTPEMAQTKLDFELLSTFFVRNPQGVVTSISDGCQATFTAKFQERANALLPTPNSDAIALWADVWPMAVNGNFFMQSWGVTFPDRPVTAFFDGISLPGKLSKQLPDAVALDGYAVGVAQAELFFDCEGAWSDPNCLDMAPWTMNWRARMRRVWDPATMAASLAEATVLDGFMSAIGQVEAPPGLNVVIQRLNEVLDTGSFSNVPDRNAETAYAKLSGRESTAANWAKAQLDSTSRSRMVH